MTNGNPEPELRQTKLLFYERNDVATLAGVVFVAIGAEKNRQQCGQAA
ncbi:hypothetical protein [Bauldia litoralis]